jgi:hypothetical protein
MYLSLVSPKGNQVNIPELELALYYSDRRKLGWMWLLAATHAQTWRRRQMAREELSFLVNTDCWLYGWHVLVCGIELLGEAEISVEELSFTRPLPRFLSLLYGGRGIDWDVKAQSGLRLTALEKPRDDFFLTKVKWITL